VDAKTPRARVRMDSKMRSWLARAAIVLVVGAIFVAFVMWTQPNRYSNPAPLAAGTYDYSDFGFEQMQLRDGVFSARLLMQGFRTTESSVHSNADTRFILLTGRTDVADFYKHISQSRYGRGLYTLKVDEGGSIIEIRETAAEAFP